MMIVPHCTTSLIIPESPNSCSIHTLFTSFYIPSPFDVPWTLLKKSATLQGSVLRTKLCSANQSKLASSCYEKPIRKKKSSKVHTSCQGRLLCILGAKKIKDARGLGRRAQPGLAYQQRWVEGYEQGTGIVHN